MTYYKGMQVNAFGIPVVIVALIFGGFYSKLFNNGKEKSILDLPIASPMPMVKTNTAANLTIITKKSFSECFHACLHVVLRVSNLGEVHRKGRFITKYR
jgi:hypothetical protein